MRPHRRLGADKAGLAPQHDRYLLHQARLHDPDRLVIRHQCRQQGGKFRRLLPLHKQIMAEKAMRPGVVTDPRLAVHRAWPGTLEIHKGAVAGMGRQPMQ